MSTEGLFYLIFIVWTMIASLGGVWIGIRIGRAAANLASPEWQTREAVVEAAQLRAKLGDLKAHHVLTCPECERLEAEEDRWCDQATKLGRQGLDADKACRAALARLDAGQDE